MSKRVVVEIRADLHKELRKLAAATDSRLYTITNVLLEDCLSDKQRVQAVLKHLNEQ